jgi:hypothetical protein
VERYKDMTSLGWEARCLPSPRSVQCVLPRLLAHHHMQQERYGRTPPRSTVPIGCSFFRDINKTDTPQCYTNRLIPHLDLSLRPSREHLAGLLL